jgi:hypothetical protein
VPDALSFAPGDQSDSATSAAAATAASSTIVGTSWMAPSQPGSWPPTRAAAATATPTPQTASVHGGTRRSGARQRSLSASPRGGAS